MRSTIKRALILAGALSALGLTEAEAADCRGISFPDQARVDGSVLSLNGLGARLATMFNVHVYIAALYVPRTSTNPEALIASPAPAELILHFLRDVGVGDIREAWSEGFARNAGAQLPALQERIATLNGWMADMGSGQRLVFTFRPGVGVQVSVHGSVRGTIGGEDFSRAFLSVFLGAHPANSELKSGLLGGACS